MSDAEYVPYSDANITNVGEGWQPIIEKALTAIRLIDPGATVVQIKEKFGGLRLYMQASEDAVDEAKWAVQAIAHEAEREAGNRCEECGGFPAHNEPVYKWYRTLCPDHRAEAWIAAHERMASPASEFPSGEPPEYVEPPDYDVIEEAEPPDPALPTGLCERTDPHQQHREDTEHGPYWCIGRDEYGAPQAHLMDPEDEGGDVGVPPYVEGD